MKKISVVIPCYNASAYLDRCMEHILKQTIGLENIEIILVDDASSDGGATLSLMMGYEKRYPDNIIVIPLEQNLRQGGARNIGIMYAGGEYLLFCDADDWLMLDAMEILYHIASKYEADVVEFQFKEVMAQGDGTVKDSVLDKYMGETDFEKGISEKIKYNVWEFNEDDKKRNEFMICSSERCGLGAINKLYRMRMIKDNHIRFVEHLICEEPSFTLPVRVYEKKHVLIDAKPYCYFKSSNSTMRSNWDDKKLDNLKVWLKIVQDFEERGVFEKYHKEIEYMFYEWGLWLSIKMLIARGYTVTEEELCFLKKAVLQLFPDVLKNPYIVEQKESSWNILMQTLLKTELTGENVPEFNRMICVYIQKWEELIRG